MIKFVRDKRFVYFLLGACMVMLIAMCVILSVTGKPAEIPFTPPPFDATAQNGVPTVPDGLGYSEVYNEEMAFRVSICGEIRIDEQGKAKVYLTNPESNTLWIKLRILSETGEILGETGLIKPGQYLEEATFQILPNSGDKIVLKLMSYQPETYHSGGAVSLTTVAKTEGVS